MLTESNWNSTASQVNRPAKAEPAVYATGEGSPISQILVFDADSSTWEQLLDISKKTPVPEGCLRLYRGIGEAYIHGHGSNYFSADIAIAHSCAQDGSCPQVVIADIPMSSLRDINTYHELQRVANIRWGGLSEGGMTVVEVPADWISGQPVNKAILKDMTGLSQEFDNRTKALGIDVRDQDEMLNERFKMETKIAIEYRDKTGTNFFKLPSKERFKLIKADERYQQIQNRLDDVFATEQALLLELAQARPTIVPPVSASTANETRPQQPHRSLWSRLRHFGR